MGSGPESAVRAVVTLAATGAAVAKTTAATANTTSARAARGTGDESDADHCGTDDQDRVEIVVPIRRAVQQRYRPPHRDAEDDGHQDAATRIALRRLQSAAAPIATTAPTAGERDRVVLVDDALPEAERRSPVTSSHPPQTINATRRPVVPRLAPKMHEADDKEEGAVGRAMKQPSPNDGVEHPR